MSTVDMLCGVKVVNRFVKIVSPCGRRFDEGSYKEFRQHSLEEAAMAAARHASVSKLMVLCERHPHRLLPGLLTLLACLPETEPADSYSQLLLMASHLQHSTACQSHSSQPVASTVSHCCDMSVYQLCQKGQTKAARRTLQGLLQGCGHFELICVLLHHTAEDLAQAAAAAKWTLHVTAGCKF